MYQVKTTTKNKNPSLNRQTEKKKRKSLFPKRFPVIRDKWALADC